MSISNLFDVRLIAFYLPQFHPIPENDRWWRKGFTEWTNVVKTRPLFKGHYQPHLPADLGFYDLRVPETRQAQADLAREYGVHGFCYYHYWFGGKRLLERPFNDVLSSGEPDFPFCLCWANESWSRRWDGQDTEILMEQTYSPEDDIAHLRSLLPAFLDRRYIRIQERPVFLVYHASQLPDAAGTVRRWRQEAEGAGLPGLYLCNVESFGADHGLVPSAGFDAAVEFAPDWTCLPPIRRQQLWRSVGSRLGLEKGVEGRHKIREYGQLVEHMLAKAKPSYLRYPCVTPFWDNSARRQHGASIFTSSTPERYGQWLAATLDRFESPSSEENLVFINAWNEWAEGNHLEPCQRWGRAYLEATRDALRQAQRRAASPNSSATALVDAA